MKTGLWSMETICGRIADVYETQSSSSCFGMGIQPLNLDGKMRTFDYPLPMAEENEEGSFGFLFRQLMTSEQFRQMFAARVDKWCVKEGVLEASACE